MLKIHRDKDVNKFLPWWPVKTLDEARSFYDERYAPVYAKERAYHYAICFKKDDYPIGYANIQMNDSYDLGYGLRKEYWNRGIVTEACAAIVKQAKNGGVPYITATHDRDNPASGKVMQKLGMVYAYSYEEQWQPKGFLVTFRMYQLNLNGQHDIYPEYWNRSAVKFIEEIAD